MRANQYDIGFGCLGNGTTVWNRKEEIHGDYRTIAHISDNGRVKFYEEDLPIEVIKQINKVAQIHHAE